MAAASSCAGVVQRSNARHHPVSRRQGRLGPSSGATAWRTFGSSVPGLRQQVGNDIRAVPAASEQVVSTRPPPVTCRVSRTISSGSMPLPGLVSRTWVGRRGPTACASCSSASASARYSEATEGCLPVFFPVLVVSFGVDVLERQAMVPDQGLDQPLLAQGDLPQLRPAQDGHSTARVPDSLTLGASAEMSRRRPAPPGSSAAGQPQKGLAAARRYSSQFYWLRPP